MVFFQRFPYTDDHQLNLNWLVKLWKTLAGGSTGQVLKKRSNKDYDWEWESGGGPSPYTSNPEAPGTATPGSSDNYSRGDHVHPMPAASDVGAMHKWVLLWTNASPSSDFAAQTIPLDLSNYDQVAIIANRSTSGTYRTPCLIAEKNEDVQISFIYYTGNTPVNSWRIVNANDNGVVVSDASYIYNGSALQTIQNVIIPYKIYGIKGVQ